MIKHLDSNPENDAITESTQADYKLSGNQQKKCRPHSFVITNEAESLESFAKVQNFAIIHNLSTFDPYSPTDNFKLLPQ